jgi:endonuclease/exonuclease/phosphatase family metal-dependent hydrolase
MFGQLLFSQEVKVMSYNIRLGSVDDGENNWEFRKNKVADLMNYYEADFIGMQEAQKFQLEFLLKNMPDYESIGDPRTKLENAEYSNILYNKNTATLIQQSTFWLSETSDSISMGWDAAYHRITTYGLFKINGTENFIWVINSHFDNVGVISKFESAKLIVQKIEELLNIKNCDVVFTGDLNSRPNQEPILYLSQHLLDTRTNSLTKPYGNQATWNGFNFNKEPEGIIDYIFLRNSNLLKIAKFITIDDFYNFKYPSDHFPIMVTLRY